MSANDRSGDNDLTIFGRYAYKEFNVWCDGVQAGSGRPVRRAVVGEMGASAPSRSSEVGSKSVAWEKKLGLVEGARL